MGKIDRRRKGGSQQGHLPVKRPKLNRSQPSQSAQTTINVVKQQLLNSNLEERLCALQTIGTYLESEEYVKLMVENDIVKIMLTLLLDGNSQIRNATAGTLRNFSTLSLDACQYLIEQNVMTFLTTFFDKYNKDWIPSQVHGHLDEDGDTFLQSVYLLWNLCECAESSVDCVNKSHVLPILLRCINREIFGDELVIAIFHCLLVIIEDNPRAVQEITELCELPMNELLSSDDSSPSGILLKTLAAGITLNLKYPNVLLAPIDFVKNILNILVTVLSVDLRNLYHKISSSLPLQSEDKIDASVEKEIENIKRLVDAQQTSIEIITNICSPEDDDAMDTGENSEADSDMDDDEEETCNGNDNGSSFVANKLPHEFIEAIGSFNTAKIVWDKTSSLADNVIEILKASESGKLIFNRYQTMQSRALLCMNNFIENLPIEVLVGYESVYKIWVESGNMVFKISHNMSNMDILESATFVMRAALDKLKSNLFQSNNATNITNLFNGLSTNDLQDICNGISKCENTEIRVNLTRMLGTLALILNSKSPNCPSDVEAHIAAFLIDRLSKETDIWPLADLLDTILDLFAEDETDRLAQKTNLIDKLIEIVPIVKTKAKQQKKQSGEHLAVIRTAVDNLPRFIKYKKKRVEILNKSHRSLLQ